MKNKKDLGNNKINLFELLVKTSYLTVTTNPKDSNFFNILSFGSGFIVNYENNLFFVTADHTLHIDDYQSNTPQRTGNDYIISIVNNIKPKDNPLSTIITPLSGFYYMEEFNLEKPHKSGELVDITISKLKKNDLNYPFFTDKVIFSDITIEKGEEKLSLKKESFAKPDKNKNYFIFGSLAEIDGIKLKRKLTLKDGIKYISKEGDYYLLNTSRKILNDEEWKGLSGSPVISEDGYCIGVLSSIIVNSNSIWVLPIDKVEMLIQVIIMEENLEKKKEKL